MYKSFIILLLFISSTVFSEEVVNVSEGQEIRISVPLINNVDKVVIFEEPISIGVSGAFKKVVRTRSIGNTVYFTAVKKSEQRFRIVGRGLKSKKTYTFLITVSESDNDIDAVRVITSTTGSSKNSKAFFSKSHSSPVELVRFVSQSLFAPSYAIEPVNGVRMVPHSLPNDLDFLYVGASLDISPLVSYKSGKWIVTALNVVNKSKTLEHPLGPSSLLKFHPRVKAEGASAQHKYLGTKSNDNSSVIYLVTEGSLAKNIKVGF